MALAHKGPFRGLVFWRSIRPMGSNEPDWTTSPIIFIATSSCRRRKPGKREAPTCVNRYSRSDARRGIKCSERSVQRRHSSRRNRSSRWDFSFRKFRAALACKPFLSPAARTPPVKDIGPEPRKHEYVGTEMLLECICRWVVTEREREEESGREERRFI